jgi:opacity protein-like surface antigen
MLRRGPALCSLIGLLFAGTASAQTQPAVAQPIGLSLGLRAGYAIPGGNIGKREAQDQDDPLSDGVKGMIPFWLDLGFRITPHLAVGASLQYGYGLLNKDNLQGCNDCSADVIAFGAHVYLHAAPGGGFDPWVGLGAGYEVLHINAVLDQGGQPINAAVSLNGLQYVILQAGGDIATGSAITLGPFFAVSMGKYGSASTSLSIGGRTMKDSRDLQSTSWHQWVTLGLQGRFNL